MEWEDQWARFADEQARAHIQASGFQALDFREQVGGIHHHAVADVASHAFSHDARGDQLQGRLLAIDDQGVAGVVTALETHDSSGVVGQPVDDLAFAFVTPLGADDHDVAGLSGRGGRVGTDRR